MTDRHVETYIGVEPADAENVELHYVRGTLRLRYVDWKERQQEMVFQEVLAFRWEDEFESATLRDDTTYEVLDSSWLAGYAVLQVQGQKYAHYKIFFNACGVLNLLCQAVPNAKARTSA